MASQTTPFFSGSADSVSETIRLFSCPHEARFVRINPMTWEGHLSLAFDLLGCPVEHPTRVCKPIRPPQFGVVDCEVDGDDMFCNAYCQGNKVFESDGPVISSTCTETLGTFDRATLPPCIDKLATQEPTINITGYCMEMEHDCSKVANGDYQYCADCHYFGTCSHGYLYVRACPVNLRFDSINRLCDYKSRTCSTKNRKIDWTGHDEDNI